MPEHEWRRFITNLMQCFLDCAIKSQFVILENADASDEFVQFKMNHRILYGEVGSREWDVAERRRPLDPDAREMLATLGFTHGGPERNYICDNLAQSAPYLADLIMRLNVAAYGSLPASFKVKSDVVAVRALAGPLANVPKPTAYFWRWPQHKALRSTPVNAPPGLKFRSRACPPEQLRGNRLHDRRARSTALRSRESGLIRSATGVGAGLDSQS